MRRAVNWVLLFCFSLTGLGAPTPAAIGLLSLGSPDSGESRRALELVEARLRKWLENEGAAGVVHPLGSASRGILYRERRRLALEGTLASLEGGADWRKVKELETSLAGEDLREWGSAGVKALLWKAALRLREGKKGDARRALEAGLRLAPEEIHWPAPLVPANGDEGWEALVLAALGSVKRDCHVAFDPVPTDLLINGQRVAAREALAVPSGVVHRVRWNGVPAEADCRRPGRLSLMLPESRGEARSLVELGGAHRLRHYCVIEPLGDTFRFHLFTAGVGLDEIPLREPLSVRAVLRDPQQRSLPVDGEGFRRLRESHGLWATLGVPAGPGPAFGEGLVAGAAVRESRWYNNWTTWAIGGALVAGAVIAVFATRRSPVSTQAHGGLRIQIQ